MMVGFITKGIGVGRRVIPIKASVKSLKQYEIKTHYDPATVDFIRDMKEHKKRADMMRSFEKEIIADIGVDNYNAVIKLMKVVYSDDFDRFAYYKKHKLDWFKMSFALKDDFITIPRLFKKVGGGHTMDNIYASTVQSMVIVLEGEKLGIPKQALLSMVVLANTTIHTGSSDDKINKKIAEVYLGDMVMYKNYKPYKNRVEKGIHTWDYFMTAKDKMDIIDKVKVGKV